MNSITNYNKRGHFIKVFILLIYLNISIYNKALEIYNYIYITVIRGGGGEIPIM